MNVILNGEAKSLAGAKNVRMLIEELELPAAIMLVEHNGLALRRDEWEATCLNEGDRLEMIRVAAGG